MVVLFLIIIIKTTTLSIVLRILGMISKFTGNHPNDHLIQYRLLGDEQLSKAKRLRSKADSEGC